MTESQAAFSTRLSALAAAVAATLTACGGGSSQDTLSAPAATPAPAPASAPAPAPVVTLTGVAAIGAALGGVTVEARCGSGSGTAVTGSDGRYSLSISSGSLPCVVKAPLADGSALYSAAAGSGAGDAVANITPLTQLVVAGAAGVLPATLFDEFSSRQAAVTATALAAGVAQVGSTLNGVVDLAGVNPLTDALVVGNALDQKLETLATALTAAGSSLAQLTLAVAGSSAAAPAPAPGAADTTPNTTALPAELLLKPAAAHCAALRSGTYRRVLLAAGADSTDYAVDTLQVDAAALTLTDSAGTVTTLSALGTCRFSGIGVEAVVTQAGVIGLRSRNSAGQFRSAIAFPEQAHTVAELAGTWDTLGMERFDPASANFSPLSSTWVVDASGKFTGGQGCADLKTCSTPSPLPSINLASAAGGGFTMTNSTQGWVDRVFAYRAGNGDLMLVSKAAGGSFTMATRQRSAGLPTVDGIGRSFNLNLASTLLTPGAIGQSANTVVSVDSASGGYTRRIVLNSGATYTEALKVNQPRTGYLNRLPATATASDGSSVTVREFVALSMRGMGFTPVAFPAVGSSTATFTLSVNEPGSTWLPAVLIGRAYAANCAALRSGSLRVVEAKPGQPFSTTTLTLDAATLQLKRADGTVDATLVANGPCRYKSASDATELVVSQAGVGVFRAPEDDGTVRVGLLFPEQTVPLADLAGSWTKLGWTAGSGGVYGAEAASVTYDANGAATAAATCADVATCTPVTGLALTTTVNPAGGFTRSFGNGSSNRQFAYRAGNGDLMLVTLDGDGSLGLWTQQRANALPTVGVRTQTWDVAIDKALKSADSSGIPSSASTIRSVDATTGRYERARSTASGAGYTETVLANAPRNGFSTRPAATTTASDGSAVTVREFTALNLRGMGLSALTLPALQWYMVSVTQP